MSNPTKLETKKTIRQQAAELVAKERADKALKAMTDKLRERDAAQTVVDNIDREIDDLEQAIAQGNDV